MKRLLIVFTALVLCFVTVFSLAACDEETEAPVTSVPNEAPAVSTPAADSTLHAEITEDVHFKQFDVFYSFGNDEYEDYMLWCEAEMTDFYIVGLIPDTENWITDGVKLFEKDRITPKEAVNYMRMVPEGFPSDAVVYTANGETFMYAIGYNGRDGGISLIEIDRLFVDPEAGVSEETTTTTEATTTTTKATTTTTASTEIMAEIYWVSDDLSIFVREMTIESDSKWHVWKALKSLNKQIPTKCSLISGEMVKGRNGIMELDFSEEFMEVGNSMKGRPVLEAIANTYITTYDLQAVRFKVEGKYLESAICGYAEEFAYTEC